MALRDYNKIENTIDIILRDVKPCSVAEVYEGLGAAVNSSIL